MQAMSSPTVALTLNDNGTITVDLDEVIAFLDSMPAKAGLDSLKCFRDSTRKHEND